MFSPADPSKRTFHDLDFPFPVDILHNPKKTKKSDKSKLSRLVIDKPLHTFEMDKDIIPFAKLDNKKVTVILSPLKEKQIQENADPLVDMVSKMVIDPPKSKLPLPNIIKPIKLTQKLAQKRPEAEIVTEHAAMRVNLIYQAMVVYWQKAVRSDGSIRDFHVSVRKADLQVGQAHSTQHHAAHAFPASGLVDDLWNRMIFEKQTEEKLTPKKEMILGALHDAHKKMQEQLFEPENIPSPLAEGVKRTIWTGTPASIGLNRTTIVHTNVNLIVDRQLELDVRREFIPELVRLSAQGKVEPHHLTKMFVDRARTHFEAKIKEYQTHITQIKNDSYKSLKKEISYYERLILLTQAALAGTVEPNYAEIFGKFDPATMQKAMLTGDELFKRSLEVLKQYQPEKY